jgi:uncharacterized protein
MDKLAKLKKIIAGYGSCLVAFSGGADSSFLLSIASRMLAKDKLLAVTAKSATYPPEELAFAREFARSLKVRHKVISTAELSDKRFVANPRRRCYFCKRELFSRLKVIAGGNKLNFVLDASNISDKSDFRPGVRAKDELGVRSPLQQAGFTKEDIRRASKRLGLSTWNKPALACLASRIPYGTRISPALLARINRAEHLLRALGLTQVRLRHYGRLCRIEALKKETPLLLRRGEYVVDKLKGLGYNYVTVDLQGYRTGSMNEGIKR